MELNRPLKILAAVMVFLLSLTLLSLLLSPVVFKSAFSYRANKYLRKVRGELIFCKAPLYDALSTLIKEMDASILISSPKLILPQGIRIHHNTKRLKTLQRNLKNLIIKAEDRLPFEVDEGSSKLCLILLSGHGAPMSLSKLKSNSGSLTSIKALTQNPRYLIVLLFSPPSRPSPSFQLWVASFKLASGISTLWLLLTLILSGLLSYAATLLANRYLPSLPLSRKEKEAPQVAQEVTQGEGAKRASKDSQAELESKSTTTQESSEERVFANYQLAQKIGEGGMATVYLGYKLTETGPDTSQKYAIKIMNSFVDEEAYQRFMREIEISSELKHPNIIKVYEGGVWNGKPYIVMEYVDGYTLDELIKKRSLTLAEKLGIMKRICYGLAYAHQKGIIHRDIKPSNILVSKDLKKVKITDFGLAKMLIKKSITLTGTTLGTPYYMAPEQLESRNVDHRADIYALGVTFYELLSGKLPFEGDPVSIIYKHLKEKPKPLRELIKDIPPELDHIVMRMLEKSPDRRFKSVDEVIKTLDLVIQRHINKEELREPDEAPESPNDKKNTPKRDSIIE